MGIFFTVDLKINKNIEMRVRTEAALKIHTLKSVVTRHLRGTEGAGAMTVIKATGVMRAAGVKKESRVMKEIGVVPLINKGTHSLKILRL